MSDWADETTNAVIVKYGDRTGTGYVLLKPLIAQALRDLAAEKDKEIERLKAAIDKQIETHNQSCVCPCCTASLAWTTEKDQKP